VKLEFTYFKPSGKYYSNGEMEINDKSEFYATMSVIKYKLGCGENPGLIDGSVVGGKYDTLITCDEAFDGIGWPPHLIKFTDL
jgi:hypothetical protein